LFQHFHYTAPWVLWAYERLYADLDISRILAPAYAEELDAAVNDLCILGAQARYPSVASSLYTEEFFAALESGTLQQSFPELDEMFVANATGMAAHRLPVMILHGVNDPVVPLLVQDDFVEQLCELGSP